MDEGELDQVIIFDVGFIVNFLWVLCCNLFWCEGNLFTLYLWTFTSAFARIRVHHHGLYVPFDVVNGSVIASHYGLKLFKCHQIWLINLMNILVRGPYTHIASQNIDFDVYAMVPFIIVRTLTQFRLFVF